MKRVCSNGAVSTLSTCSGGGQQAKIFVKQSTKKGYIECVNNGIANLSYPNSSSKRGRVQGGGKISPTITTNNILCGVNQGYKVRKLTPKEYYRLMGFSDVDFQKAEFVVSETQLYKQAGNSIVVDVLYYIF